MCPPRGGIVHFATSIPSFCCPSPAGTQAPHPTDPEGGGAERRRDGLSSRLRGPRSRIPQGTCHPSNGPEPWASYRAIALDTAQSMGIGPSLSREVRRRPGIPRHSLITRQDHPAGLPSLERYDDSAGSSCRVVVDQDELVGW